MPKISRIVVLGDSVPWGQGLLPAHKCVALVAASAGTATTRIEVRAHSGAVIGVQREGQGGAPDCEIPDSYPTVWIQCKDFSDDPSNVDLVLVNGGINDVDIRTILNPLTSFVALGDRTKLHCYYHMKVLLIAVGSKFPNPNTRIVVTSYYPILSPDSELFRIVPFLQLHGIALPAHLYSDPLIGKIVSLCLQFWHDSEMWIGRATEEVNAAAGGNRMRFAVPQFTEKNAVFASDPWLWGIGPDLSPQDEVAQSRIRACNAFYSAPEDLFAREQCFRASAGHPNIKGASAFADAILRQMD